MEQKQSNNTIWISKYVVQGNYGYQYGWEDVCSSLDRKEARGWLRDYRVNETEYPHRMVIRKESRLFVGAYPEGIVYGDRLCAAWQDYKQLAFLDYKTLTLRMEQGVPSRLRRKIEAEAAKVQARRGERFEVSASGQYVILGE